MNYDISKDHKTIFEIIPNSISILNELTRGIARGGDKTKYSKVYYKLKSHFTNKTSEVDQVSRRIILKNCERLPDFSFVVFLGIDNYSHLTHPFHKSVLDSYRIIDQSVGELAQSLSRKDMLEETLILIVSDHGLSQTHSHFDLLEYMNKSGFKTFYYPNIFRNLISPSAANMVSGNSMSNLYFKGTQSWNGFNADEIIDFMNRLVQRPEIDILLVKQSNARIKIVSKRGSGQTWIDTKNNINYEIIDNDPFGYQALPPVMTIYESLQNTYNTNYPDALLQINQLFESPRTGDIVVTASPGYDLRAKHENPEHCSSHGSLIRDHMLVPIAVNTEISSEFTRTVDIFPTMLKLLGYELPQFLDGRSLVN
jgi:arylsulfatase A-like enzyme